MFANLSLINTEKRQLAGPVEQVGKADESIRYIQIEQQHSS